MEKKKSKGFLAAAVSLLFVVFFSTMMWGFATDWGYVRSTRIQIIGDDGLRYSALMFIPKNATNETPAPAMIPLHGGSSQARDVEDWGVEMARRGFVVLVPDAAGGGQSERYNTDDYITAPVDALFKYLLTLPIVNTNEITAVGHSQGTTSTVFLTNNYIDHLAAIVNICGPYKLDDSQRFETNLLTVIGTHDNVLIQGDDSLFTTGSFSNLYMTFQREGLDEIKGWTNTRDIEINKLYGSFENRTARMLAQVDMTHDGGRFSAEATSLFVDFLQNSVNTPHVIDPSNLAFIKKDVCGLLDIFALLALFCTTGSLLLETAFFSSLKKPMPQRVGYSTKGEWWLSVAISAVSGIILWMTPLVQNSTRTITLYSVFPANQLNQAVLWMVLSAALGIVLFTVYHIVEGKKHGGNLLTYGIISSGSSASNWINIGKAILLTVIICCEMFLLLNQIENITGFAPRLWSIIFSSTTYHRIAKMPSYLICYIFAFGVSALSMNIERRLPDSGNEAKDTAIAVIVNALIAALPMLILLAVQYFLGYLQMTEPCARNSFTNIVMHPFYFLPFTISAASGVNTYFYRKSGTIWLGAFASALLTAVNMVGNNCLKL